MTANKPKDLGDVHAPVEDTDVPATLKFLVVLMVIFLIGIAFVISLIVTQPGLFSG